MVFVIVSWILCLSDAGANGSADNRNEDGSICNISKIQDLSLVIFLLHLHSWDSCIPHWHCKKGSDD